LIVVSDTSPVLNLAAVNRLNLLRDLYAEIVIPPAVAQELKLNGVQMELSWARVVAARNQDEVEALREQLDPGEAEAIVLAGDLAADLLLVDEKPGTACSGESRSGSDRSIWRARRSESARLGSPLQACFG
jgi:predicted nucleic acid-binding protein